MCGHLYLVGFPLLDDDAWQGGRCWDGAMMCHVISPEKTGNDCFPVNLWCEVFNARHVVHTNWQDFRYFLCDLVTELMRYMGSRGHMIFPFIDYHHDLRCLSFYFYVRMWLWLMISSTSAGLDSICRSGFFIQIPLSFNSLSHLFTFNGLRTTWRWFFPPFWIGNFKLMAIQGKSPAYPSGLGHNFSKAACWRRWWELYNIYIYYMCPLLE